MTAREKKMFSKRHTLKCKPGFFPICG